MSTSLCRFKDNAEKVNPYSWYAAVTLTLNDFMCPVPSGLP